MSLSFYQATPDEDVLLAAWYWRMAQDGDLAKIFTPDSRSLSAFFRLMGRPKTLWYARDTDGIWFAMWGESFLNGAWIGLWTRADKRRSRGMVYAMLDAATYYLTVVPAIFGVTRHEKLLESAEALGYDVVKKVNDLWAPGEPAWFVMMTRESLEKTLKAWRRPSVELTQVMEAHR